MPCYNGERYLAEAIECVLNQSYPVAELIVVDDGSSDSSRAIAASYADRFPQVKPLPLPHNQGAARARNQAIAKSTGEFLIITDCDDRLLPHAVETGLKALEDHPDWMFAFGPCRLIDEDGQQAAQGRKVLEQPVLNQVYETLLRGTCLNPPGRHLFRRSLFEAIGGFDTSLRATDDYDFYLRAAAQFPGGGYEQPAIEYREHSNTLSQRTCVSRHFREVLAVYAKQKPFAARSPETAAAHYEGLEHWRSLYSPYLSYDIPQYLKKGQFQEAAAVLNLVLRHCPQELFAFAGTKVGKLLQFS